LIFYQTSYGKTRGRLQKSTDGRFWYYNDAFVVHQFGARLSDPSECPLCDFFRSHRVQPGKHERYKLLACLSSESWLFETRLLPKFKVLEDEKDSIYMAVVPDDDLLPPGAYKETWLDREVPSAGIFLRELGGDNKTVDRVSLLRARQIGANPNFELIKWWLVHCENYHGADCHRQSGSEPVTRGFRLIDCHQDPKTPPELKPWGTEYVALSYVWGASPADLEAWPQIVLDAVTATKELGLQYLWVDRLCINQEDDDEKSYLISRMTSIYEQAYFTIVAAAGSGASHGIPGVGSTPREVQPSYRLPNGDLLLSALRDPRHDIIESDYWTRGWTYQEGVLSNRRIVFTQRQVYWECRCMATHESIQLPLYHQPKTTYGSANPNSNVTAKTNSDSDKNHDKDKDKDSGNKEMLMADFMLTGIFRGSILTGGFQGDNDQLIITSDQTHRLDYGFPYYGQARLRAQLRGLDDHIRAFSYRKLSYDGDALRAFLGIIGMYRRTENDIFLVQGLPVWMGDIARDMTGVYITFALSVSSWFHRAGDAQTMFVSEPRRRRQGGNLPSWTWAGWEGAVSWRVLPDHEHCSFMADLIRAESLAFVWVADISIQNPDQRTAIRLLNTYDTARLEDEMPTLMVINDPLVLKYFFRREVNPEWQWARYAGRAEQHVGRPDWDGKWYRIAGRLSVVNMSIAITEAEWTEKHESGELISVLAFAGVADSGHASARFLTLRRVKDGDGRWERVGVLYLTIPAVSLAKCHSNDDFIGQIPVHERLGTVVVQ